MDCFPCSLGAVAADTHMRVCAPFSQHVLRVPRVQHNLRVWFQNKRAQERMYLDQLRIQEEAERKPGPAHTSQFLRKLLAEVPEPRTDSVNFTKNYARKLPNSVILEERRIQRKNFEDIMGYPMENVPATVLTITSPSPTHKSVGHTTTEESSLASSAAGEDNACRVSGIVKKIGCGNKVSVYLCISPYVALTTPPLAAGVLSGDLPRSAESKSQQHQRMKTKKRHKKKDAVVEQQQESSLRPQRASKGGETASAAPRSPGPARLRASAHRRRRSRPGTSSRAASSAAGSRGR